MKNKLWKLAKMIMNFKEYETEQGKLVVNGEIEVGTEVAVENENGELQPAEGEYIIDGLKVTVEAGKITEVEKPEPENEPEPEPEEQKPEEMEQPETQEPKNDEPDAKDLKIQELEGLLADRDAIIEELNAKIKDLEEKINKPVDSPIKLGKVAQEKQNCPVNGALKYFKN
jgi:hypothetical protein